MRSVRRGVSTTSLIFKTFENPFHIGSRYSLVRDAYIAIGSIANNQGFISLKYERHIRTQYDRLELVTGT
jgi:hypothetical protein